MIDVSKGRTGAIRAAGGLRTLATIEDAAEAAARRRRESI